MRIVILVPLFPPKWLAGTEIATFNLAKGLSKKAHDVHIITSFDQGLQKKCWENGFYIHRIEYPDIKYFGIIIFWLRVLLLSKELKPDVVHAQSIGIGISGFLLKTFLKTPYVVWGQGSDIYLPWLFKKQISKLVLIFADAVIALTQDMKREMQKVCSRTIYVIPNGIDLERFKNLPTKRTMRGLLGLGNSEKIILFVGTLRPIKGLKYLISAMPVIRQNDTNVRLLLVGDGVEKGNLERLVRELALGSQVSFIGKVPNEKVIEYMVASDLFILPSLSEGFPITILEAMASGLPIIATNIKGLPEVVKDFENGFLIEPKNPENIAEQILLLLNDCALRKNISRNNKEKMKQYSLEGVVTRLEEVYLSIMK